MEDHYGKNYSRKEELDEFDFVTGDRPKYEKVKQKLKGKKKAINR